MNERFGFMKSIAATKHVQRRVLMKIAIRLHRRIACDYMAWFLSSAFLFFFNRQTLSRCGCLFVCFIFFLSNYFSHIYYHTLGRHFANATFNDIARQLFNWHCILTIKSDTHATHFSSLDISIFFGVARVGWILSHRDFLSFLNNNLPEAIFTLAWTVSSLGCSGLRCKNLINYGYKINGSYIPSFMIKFSSL